MDSIMEHIFESQSLRSAWFSFRRTLKKFSNAQMFLQTHLQSGTWIQLVMMMPEHGERVFRQQVKESSIDQASDESPDEGHFFMDSANY
jgi:hypothetical protein